MTQAAHVYPDPLDVFRERCEAQAYLVEAGAIAFLDAIDNLQTDAEWDGLVDRYGQDKIQLIMARAFDGAAR
jgi:hypothetical protein